MTTAISGKHLCPLLYNILIYVTFCIFVTILWYKYYYLYLCTVIWGLKKFKQSDMCSVSWGNSEFKPGLFNHRTCYTASVTMIKNL